MVTIYVALKLFQLSPYFFGTVFNAFDFLWFELRVKRHSVFLSNDYTLLLENFKEFVYVDMLKDNHFVEFQASVAGRF